MCYINFLKMKKFWRSRRLHRKCWRRVTWNIQCWRWIVWNVIQCGRVVTKSWTMYVRFICVVVVVVDGDEVVRTEPCSINRDLFLFFILKWRGCYVDVNIWYTKECLCVVSLLQNSITLNVFGCPTSVIVTNTENPSRNIASDKAQVISLLLSRSIFISLSVTE